MFVAENGDMDMADSEALHMAAWHNHAKVIKVLVSNGACNEDIAPGGICDLVIAVP